MSMVERIAITDNYSAQVVSSARGIRPARMRGARSRWVLGNAVAVILALLMTLTFAVRSSESANANWFTDAIKGVFCTESAFFNQPQPWSNGLMSLGVTSSSLGDAIGSLSSGDPDILATRQTAYDIYGMSGTNWTVYSGETKKSIEAREGQSVNDEKTDLRTSSYTCWPIPQVASAYFANMMFGVTKFVTAISSWLFSQAFEPDWLNDINDKVADVIAGTNGSGGLKDALYFPFLSLVVLLGALYLGWIGLVKKRSMEAGTSALWMFGCVLVGSLLMFNPALVPSMANSIVQEFSQAILIGTAGATTGSTMEDDNLCYSPVSATNDPSAKRDQVIATAECSFWVTFVYTPWTVGQWGVQPSELDGNLITNGGDLTAAPGVDLGGGTTFNNWALYQLDSQSLDQYSLSQDNTTMIKEKQDQWYKIVDAVGSEGGAGKYYFTWRGDSGGDRLAVASASIVASSLGLMVIAVLAITMLAYGLGTSILSFFSVIFLLLGAHPGIGRRLALRWAEMYVGTIFKRIVSALMLGMVLMFYGVILANASENWMTSVLAVIALSIAVMIYRKSLTNAVGEINFGGSGMGDQEASQATQRVTGMASGAVLGGVASLAGAGAVAKAAGAAPGSKVRKVGRALSAGGATAAKGAGRGAVRGAFGRAGGMSAIYAVRDSASRSRAEASAAKAKANQERRDFDAIIDTPEEYSAMARKMQSNDRKYMQDWTANHQDEKWQELFRRKYGFSAPDPHKYRFAGYGMNKQDINQNPGALMPQLRKQQGPGDGRPPTGDGRPPAGGGSPNGGAPKPPTGGPAGGGAVPQANASVAPSQGGSGNASKPGSASPSSMPRRPASATRTETAQQRAYREAEERHLKEREESLKKQGRMPRPTNGNGGGMPRPKSS